MDGYIGRILLPTDFSPESFRALQYAVTLVDPHISEIVLVHVVEPLPRGVSRWSDPSKLLETNRAQAQSKLSEFERNARDLYPHCRSELQVGNPSRVIAELASKLNVDLIVMSAHKRNGILDRLLESLPEKLLRIAPCPVLAVGTWAHPMSHERSMLALDGLA
jgi:nucleotide-binding universal stress UspA family protein